LDLKFLLVKVMRLILVSGSKPDLLQWRQGKCTCAWIFKVKFPNIEWRNAFEDPNFNFLTVRTFFEYKVCSPRHLRNIWSINKSSMPGRERKNSSQDSNLSATCDMAHDETAHVAMLQQFWHATAGVSCLAFVACSWGVFESWLEFFFTTRHWGLMILYITQMTRTTTCIQKCSHSKKLKFGSSKAFLHSMLGNFP